MPEELCEEVTTLFAAVNFKCGGLLRGWEVGNLLEIKRLRHVVSLMSEAIDEAIEILVEYRGRATELQDDEANEED